MNDWDMWLHSSETRTLLKLFKKESEEIAEDITNGSHLQEKSIEKIALDFSYSSGFLDGIRKAILMIKEIKEYSDGD